MWPDRFSFPESHGIPLPHPFLCTGALSGSLHLNYFCVIMSDTVSEHSLFIWAAGSRVFFMCIFFWIWFWFYSPSSCVLALSLSLSLPVFGGPLHTGGPVRIGTLINDA